MQKLTDNLLPPKELADDTNILSEERTREVPLLETVTLICPMFSIPSLVQS